MEVMTYFYEYIPNISDLPIYIIEANNWKEANRIFKTKFDFNEKNKFGYVWIAQNKESPNFKQPTHLEQYLIKQIKNSTKKIHNEFRILYLDNQIEILKKEL